MKTQIVNRRTATIDGETVVVTTVKPKLRKVKKYVDRSNNSCPNCQSLLVLNELGQFECSSNKLKIWEKEFFSYFRADRVGKDKIMSNISNTSLFLELYDRWEYSQNNEDDEFNCGYTNEIFPLISQSKETIPDPLVVKRVEAKLGRKLSMDELLGELPIYSYRGMIYTDWRPKAKQVRIPWICLPSQNEVSV